MTASRPATPVDLTALGARVRPLSSLADRLLPLPEPLVDLFPDRALRRGTTTLVVGQGAHGPSALSLSLLVQASQRGSWCAVVGARGFGVAAAHELGIDLDRLVVVPDPRGAWADVVATLLDGFDIVVLRVPRRMPNHAAGLLMARARDRRSCLVIQAQQAGHWPVGADLTLSVVAARWHGAGYGDGYLARRELHVSSSARRFGGRAAAAALWLPDDGGSLSRVGGN